MKNNLSFRPLNIKEALNLKLPLKMRISLILLTGAAIQLSAATSHAQNTRIPISVSNSTVEQVLNTIEKNSDYVFLYNNNINGMNRTVSVNNKGNIREILDDIFTGSNIEYSIVDNQIILSNKKQTASVAQTSTVKGTVKDNKGEALIGVNVKVKGTTSGTITDFDGNFTLQANKGDILEFSYVGYQTITMKVGNQASYQITMSEDTETLQEVVVTALGIKRETKALTYNVQEMKSEALTTVKDANLIKVSSINSIYPLVSDSRTL